MRRRQAETGQVGICDRQASELRPSPENGRLYRPFDSNDPDAQSLARSIRKPSVKEPLVVTEDSYILSGHRWMPPEQLQELMEDAIRGVLGLEAFERDCDAERAHAHRLRDVRRTVCNVLQGTDFGFPDEDEP